MKIYPYSMASASAKALAEALGIQRIKPEGKPVDAKGVLINWGASIIPRQIHHAGDLLNHPFTVGTAVNKLKAFKALEGHCSIPEWTESRDEAIRWLVEGSTIVARLKLTGHSGEGIEIYDDRPWREVAQAPLYTKYIRKHHEYRLHVFRDKVFFTQRKARNKAIPDDDVNWKIRNHANGFIFAHQDVEVDAAAQAQAIIAVKTLGLDFGAVDIILGRDLKWYVLEVNTSPGMEAGSTTLIKYKEIFQEFV